MSIVNALVQPETVVVFADTLVLGGDHAITFTSKVQFIPSAGVLLGGRGIKCVVDILGRAVVGIMPGLDVDGIAGRATGILQASWDHFYDPDVEQCREGMTVYLFGWSEAGGRFVGYAFRQRDGFTADPLGDGVLLAPGVDLEGVGLDDFNALALRQHDEEIAHEASGEMVRRQIGGDLWAYQITRVETGTQCVTVPRLRFPTYDLDADEMKTARGGLIRRHLYGLAEKTVREDG